MRDCFQATAPVTVFLTPGQAPDDAIRSTAASMVAACELDGAPVPTVEAAERALRESIARGATTVRRWA